jgi:hypothetical protein
MNISCARLTKRLCLPESLLSFRHWKHDVFAPEAQDNLNLLKPALAAQGQSFRQVW